MNRSWKDDNGVEVARVSFDDQLGITIEVDEETKNKYGKDLKELQTLAMYPPVDENGIEGIKQGDWFVYKTKVGENWERAKKEIINTFDFWIENKLPEIISL